MRRAVMLFAALLFTWALSAAAAQAQRRVALVIGNAAYVHAPPLRNPGNDARRMAETLGRLGFEVISSADADHASLQSSIRAFGRALKGADVALFYYAGHGLQVAGRNHLLPVDAALKDEADVRFETVDVALVLEQMEREPRTSIVLLDACRDNPIARNLARSMGTRSSAVGRGLAEVKGGIGTFIAFATQPDNVALDGEGPHSPFAAALLKHMERPGLRLADLMIEVRKEVIAATSGRQVPWDHSALTGPVMLRPGPPEGTVVGPAARPAMPWTTSRIELAIEGAASDLVRVVALPDGGYAAAGAVRAAEGAGHRALIVRLEPDGRERWRRSLPAEGGSATAASLAALADGGFAVAGTAQSGPAARSAAWLARLDADGKLLWERTFASSGPASATAVVVLDDGGLAFSGVGPMAAGGRHSAGWIVRTDGGGNQLWERVFGGRGHSVAWGLAALGDGGLAVAGTDAGAGGALVQRLDAKGDLAWERSLGEARAGAFVDELTAIAALPDGGVAAAGHRSATGSETTGEAQARIVRLDRDGKIVWQRRMGQAPVDGFSAIAHIPGGVLAAGTLARKRPDGSTSSVGWIVRLDGKGQPLWEHELARTHLERIGSVAALPDGGLLLAATRPARGSVSGALHILAMPPAELPAVAQGGTGRR